LSEVDGLIGETIGNYRITRLLGEGGMGAVYLGENPKIESKVAIKLLHPVHGVDSSMVKRFMGEARAVNRVGNPGIVRIHDFGDEEGIGTYLVMEFLEGLTVRDELKIRDRLPAVEVANILSQAAAALGEVHEKGIIHRDLKPENMFLVPDNALPGGTRVKILDFGIAKLTEDSPNMGSSTVTGVVFGSPSYMSHEQCCDTKNVDLRTDIYSLGVIGYELLAGRLPYKAESLGDLVRKQLMEVPPPPSLDVPDSNAALDRVVLKAMAVEADRRFGSMNDMVTAIHLSLDGVPPEAMDEEADGAPGEEELWRMEVVEVGNRTDAMSSRPKMRLSELDTVLPQNRQLKPKRSTKPGVGAVGSAYTTPETPHAKVDSGEVTAVSARRETVDSGEVTSVSARRAPPPANVLTIEVPQEEPPRTRSKVVPAAAVVLLLLALGAWGLVRGLSSGADGQTEEPPTRSAAVTEPAPDPAASARPAPVAVDIKPAPAASPDEADSSARTIGTADKPAEANKRRTPRKRRSKKPAGHRRSKLGPVKAPGTVAPRPPPKPVVEPFRSLGGAKKKTAPEPAPFDSLGPVKRQPGSKKPK